MKPLILALLAGLAMSGAAQATLIDRGGGLIYDDVLNITWLQDANYAKTSGYDADGLMTWDNAVAWADALVYHDSVRNVDYSDWRLPTLSPANTAYLFSNNGTQIGGYGASGSGYGTATPAGGWGPTGDADGIWSEMGWMYYHNLGNLGYCTPNDAAPESCVEQTGWGLVDDSANLNDETLFGKTIQFMVYWSDLESVDSGPVSGSAWYFLTNFGSQSPAGKDFGGYAWAVRPGDVAASGVPEPTTLGLLALGLLGIGLSRRCG